MARTVSALLLLASLAAGAASAQDPAPVFTSWEQVVDARTSMDSRSWVDAILRHYPGAYCDAIDQRPARMQCVAARMSQRAGLILQKHENMRQKIGVEAFAQLWVDPTSGLRDEFRGATKLMTASSWLGDEACHAAAANDAERSACTHRMLERRHETCLAGASTAADRQLCLDIKQGFDAMLSAPAPPAKSR